MEREKFYSTIRNSKSGLFGGSLSGIQVDIMERILDAGAKWSNEELAYAFATAYHECTLVPKRENLYYKTPERIKAVWPSRFPTIESARPFARNPQALANKVYNGRIGNRDGSDDGWNYRGGGLAQDTGRDNYRKLSTIIGLDLVAKPELIIEPAIAVEALLHGLKTGRWRGYKLSEFITWQKCDFVNARAIVNADVSANGAKVAQVATIFLSALNASGRKKNEAPKAPAKNEAPKAPAKNWLTVLIEAISNALKGMK